MTNGKDPISSLMPSHTDPKSILGTSSQGITKREYFAALAMQGLALSHCGDEHIQTNAEFAVKHADALIKALNESSSHE
jgi:hypothetical protein